jgi:hypothetical protein
VKSDLLELFDFAYGRLAGRMEGLTDEEWAWCPTADDRVSIRWRLAHIADMLAEDRNWRWLGASPPPRSTGPAESASGALAAVAEAFAAWRDLLAAVPDLSAPIGPAAGRYGDATRYSFTLHIADELIHHAAETALLRDLYAGRR